MPRRKPNSRKGNFNPKSKFNNGGKGKRGPAREERGFDESKLDTSNDPRWYMNVPPLVRDSAMIPFGTPSGKPMNLTEYVDLSNVGGTFKSSGITAGMTFPGVAAIEIVPTIGSNSNKSDPVNIAAQKIYAMVRRTKSGTLPYDAPDVMMYVLAMGQLYSFHNWMRRIYGYINTYSSQNLYIPRAFARVDGIDYDDFRQHMSDFRYYINSFGLKLSTYLVPQEMDIFKRHAFLYEGVYRDENVDKAQMYMFVPNCFLKFDETTLSTGTSLKRSETNAVKPDSTPLWKFSDLYAYGEDLINAIIYSEDANTISGDILRGYEAGALFKPADTPENYSVLPVYDPVVLGQIHNLTVTGHFYFKTGSNQIIIQQDVNEGIIKSELYKIGSAPIHDIIDCSSEVPSPAEILENTRLKWTVDTSDTVTLDGKTANRIICGTELVLQVVICRYTNSGNWAFAQITQPRMYATGTQTAQDVVKLISAMGKFNMFPLVLFDTSGKKVDAISAASDITPFLIGDIRNLAHLSNLNIKELHTTAMLSLFSV